MVGLEVVSQKIGAWGDGSLSRLVRGGTARLALYL